MSSVCDSDVDPKATCTLTSAGGSWAIYVSSAHKDLGVTGGGKVRKGRVR